MGFDDRYSSDIFAGHARSKKPVYRKVPATRGLVAEVVADGWVGAVTGWEKTYDGEFVRLEDRRGVDKLYKLREGAFMIDGERVTLVRHVEKQGPQRSASGSRKVAHVEAKVAAPSRIWVEGIHDAAIVEKVWGHDLRVEGVVVEYLEGLDNLQQRLDEFGPGPGRRVGVLADHLVEGSKETRLTASLGPDVFVTGHPFVDIWAAVKPASVGIPSWPDVPLGEEWKTGVCRRLGWGDRREGFNRVYNAVNSFADLDPSLIGAVERLVDFTTVPGVRKEDLR
ncbi:DUF3097 domain-containing protein [Corynebacterium mendelii]|uniref:DUF3097 domain-containing protein n=1 Tax=Corynebacterium mendelii TaxID=2765362 RepID=A0A939E0Y8_9CORY|nr:DUF3097 domain-containing protein [Corynebacterium mendelii]MBN9643472.1 DUF3097 domain-containing protein [Corynebacterium mendelii]